MRCETTGDAAKIPGMPRTNQDGKDIRLVASWLCGKFLSDADMAEAVGIPTTNYSRRKNDDDFPAFEEVQRVAEHFGLNALALQTAFGYLNVSTVLLDEEGLRQYVEQGGGDLPARRATVVPANIGLDGNSPRRRRRADAPPGP